MIDILFTCFWCIAYWYIYYLYLRLDKQYNLLLNRYFVLLQENIQLKWEATTLPGSESLQIKTNDNNPKCQEAE